MKRWAEVLIRRLYAIPWITRLWSKRMSKQLSQAGPTPFVIPQKRLHQARLALVTTGGLHLKSQTPFDMKNPNGDVSFRRLPRTARGSDIQITHKYYDHSAADKDVNVIYPIDHLHDLVTEGVLGSLADQHFSFMGHIEGNTLLKRFRKAAQTVAAEMKRDDVDLVLLTPA